jgi:nitroreductase
MDDPSARHVDHVLRTTFAARTFTDEPVTDDQVARLLDVARFAPSGGNRQGWRVVVVRDPDRKRRIIECGLPACRRYLAERAVGHNPLNTIEPSPVTDAEVAAIGDEHLAWFLAMADAPVLIVVGVDLTVVASMDAHLDRVGLVSGASVYPFVQNLLVAARSQGLAGSLTTFAAWGEPDVQALVGFPPEVAVAAVVPLGHPTQVLTKLSRFGVEEFARFETWDGPPVIMDP